MFILSAAGSSYLPSVERSASPYDSSVRGPRKSMIFGESGGIERFQLAERVLCASIAERERNLFALFSINTTCTQKQLFLLNILSPLLAIPI